MIYWLTPYVFPKLFRFFSIWLIIMASFCFLIQFPIKLSLIILKDYILSKSIYPFWIPPNFCCNNYNLLLQFFNNNTQCFTLILHFLSNLCQCPKLLTSLSFDDPNWLKSFLISLIFFCNLFLHSGSFLSAALSIFTPNLFVTRTTPA